MGHYGSESPLQSTQLFSINSPLVSPRFLTMLSLVITVNIAGPPCNSPESRRCCTVWLWNRSLKSVRSPTSRSRTSPMACLSPTAAPKLGPAWPLETTSWISQWSPLPVFSTARVSRTPIASIRFLLFLHFGLFVFSDSSSSSPNFKFRSSASMKCTWKCLVLRELYGAA